MNKLKKYFLVALISFSLANLTFCLMPKSASAEVSQPAEHSCGESAAEKKTVPEPNAVLPCCLDHDKIIKIDNSKNDNFLEMIFGSIPIGNISIFPAVLEKNISNDSLDLPPPEGDSLSSVIKKE
jgi:hypothetical protein